MAINFAGLPGAQYVGTPYPVAVQFAGQNGRAVSLNINWSAYDVVPGATGQVINVDLAGSNRGQILDKIRSIYIDNLHSDLSVYVQCIDTLYTVVAPPNSAGWFPVITNVWNFSVVILQVGNLVPVTTVIASNMIVNSYVDSEIGSTQVYYKSSAIEQQFLTTPGFGVPSLGDVTQFSNPFQIDQTTPLPISAPTLNPVAISGNNYITDVSFRCSFFGAVFSAAGVNNCIMRGKLFDIELQQLYSSWELGISVGNSNFGSLTNVEFLRWQGNVPVRASDDLLFTVDSVAAINSTGNLQTFTARFYWTFVYTFNQR